MTNDARVEPVARFMARAQLKQLGPELFEKVFADSKEGWCKGAQELLAVADEVVNKDLRVALERVAYLERVHRDSIKSLGGVINNLKATE